MHNVLQNVYQRHKDVDTEDLKIAALLVKACSAFSAVCNMDWLEWGSDLMPEMWKVLAEEECQAEIECRAHDHAERLLLLKD